MPKFHVYADFPNFGRGPSIFFQLSPMQEVRIFKDFEPFATADHKGGQPSFTKTAANQDRRWTGGIAAGNRQFAQQIRKTMGAKAKRLHQA